MILPIGTVISGRYEILEKLGSGGMAIAYRARDLKLERFVTVKVLKDEFTSDEEFKTRFQIEARSAASLSHPNIVNVYDVGEDGDIYYIVMEYVHGDTLKQAILEKAPFDNLTTVSVAIQIAAALDHAHKNHIVHRDIKPQNILVATNGTIKVTDFGIARAATTATVSTSANAIGSVHYFSPEQARGGYVDEKSDIYSLGITMYEMVTGKLPFDGDTSVAIALMHLNDELPDMRQFNPEVSRSLIGIINKATRKKADERYAGIEYLLADLKKSLTDVGGDFIAKREEGKQAIETAPTVQMSKEELAYIQSRKNRRYLEEPEPKPIPADDVQPEIQLEISRGRGSQKEIELPEPKVSFSKYAKKLKISAEDDDYESDYMYEDDPDIYDGYDDDLPEEELEEGEYEHLNKGEERKIIIAAVATALVIIALISAFGFHFLTKGGDSTTGKLANTENTVPSFLGLTYERAETKAEQYKIELENGGEEYDDEIKAGLIISQSVKEGEAIPENKKVTVVMSKGAEPAEMPKVTDLEEKDALNEINRVISFANPDVVYENDDEVPAGVVISQSPSAGAKISQGDKIRITVSRGEELKKIIVPSVVGKPQDDAKKELEELGLVVGTITEVESTKYDPGRVVTQTIPAGDEAVKNSVINLVVSKEEEEEEPPEPEPETGTETETEPPKKPEGETPDTDMPSDTPNNGTTDTPPIGAESTVKTVVLPINKPVMQDDSTQVKVTVIQIGEGGEQTTLVDEVKNLTDFPFNVAASGSGQAEIRLFINDNMIWSENINFAEDGN